MLGWITWNANSIIRLTVEIESRGSFTREPCLLFSVTNGPAFLISSLSLQVPLPSSSFPLWICHLPKRHLSLKVYTLYQYFRVPLFPCISASGPRSSREKLIVPVWPCVLPAGQMTKVDEHKLHHTAHTAFCKGHCWRKSQHRETSSVTRMKREREREAESSLTMSRGQKVRPGRCWQCDYQ